MIRLTREILPSRSLVALGQAHKRMLCSSLSLTDVSKAKTTSRRGSHTVSTRFARNRDQEVSVRNITSRVFSRCKATFGIRETGANSETKATLNYEPSSLTYWLVPLKEYVYLEQYVDFRRYSGRPRGWNRPRHSAGKFNWAGSKSEILRRQMKFSIKFCDTMKLLFIFTSDLTNQRTAAVR